MPDYEELRIHYRHHEVFVTPSADFLNFLGDYGNIFDMLSGLKYGSTESLI